MSSLRLIDLHFGGRPQAIGVYLVDTDDGPALFDCGPTSTLPSLEAAARGARARADGRPPPAPLAHPPRPRRSGRDDRPQAPEAHGLGLGDRRAASRRSVAARALGTTALRRPLRPALGRARTGARGERPHRHGRRARLGVVSDPGPRDAPRQLLPRRDAARRRRGRRAHAGRELRPAGVTAARHRRRDLARDGGGDSRAPARSGSR